MTNPQGEEHHPKKMTPRELVEERYREMEAGSSFAVPNPDIQKAMQDMMKVMRPAAAGDKPIAKVRSDDPSLKKDKEKAARVAHDSPERRQALEIHLKGLGLDEKLQQVRLLHDLGNAFPPGHTRDGRGQSHERDGRGRDQGPERGLDRGPER